MKEWPTEPNKTESVFAHLSRQSLEGFYMTALERIVELEAIEAALEQENAILIRDASRETLLAALAAQAPLSEENE